MKYKTQEEMAAKLNMSNKSYNQKAIGRQQFRLDEILKISRELDLTKEEVNQIFFDGALKE